MLHIHIFICRNSGWCGNRLHLILFSPDSCRFWEREPDSTADSRELCGRLTPGDNYRRSWFTSRCSNSLRSICERRQASLQWEERRLNKVYTPKDKWTVKCVQFLKPHDAFKLNENKTFTLLALLFIFL